MGSDRAAFARIALFAATLVSCWMGATVAWSQRALPDVSTHVSACVPIDRPEFQRLVAIELRAALDHADATGSGDRYEVTLRCVDDEISLTLSDTLRGTLVTRRVDLRNQRRSGRTRLLALAVAELVFAHWNDPRAEAQVQIEKPEQLRPPPAPQVVEPAANPGAVTTPQASEPAAEPKKSALAPAESTPADSADPAESTAPRSAAPWVATRTEPRLGAAVAMTAFSRTFELVPNLAVTFASPLMAAIALQADLQLGAATLDGELQLEDQRTRAPVRTIAGSVLLAVSYTQPLGAFDLSAGLGLRVGVAFVRGEPLDDVSVEPDASSALWAAPLSKFGLAYHATGDMRFVASVEVGYVSLGVNALGPNQAVLTLGGVWSALSLGVDWAL